MTPILELKVHPSVDFYPGDWLRDPVSGCSLAAQALWFRLMFVMHGCKPYGHLVEDGRCMSIDRILRHTGATRREYTKLMDELTRAGVPRFTGDDAYREVATLVDKRAKVAAADRFEPMFIGIDTPGVIYSRRMVRDYVIRLGKTIAGHRGGNPLLVTSRPNHSGDSMVNHPPSSMDNPPRARVARDGGGRERESSPGVLPEGGSGGTADEPLDFTGAAIVIAAFPEGLAPHPGVILEWIKRLGSAKDVAEIVRKYPDKPATYITACVDSEARRRTLNIARPIDSGLVAGASSVQPVRDRLRAAIDTFMAAHGRRRNDPEWCALFARELGFTLEQWEGDTPAEQLEQLHASVAHKEAC